MMKRHSDLWITLFGLTAFMIMPLITVRAHAQGADDRSGNFCAMLDERARVISAALDEREQNLREARFNWDTNKRAYREKSDLKTADRRAAADTLRLEAYDAMADSADTEDKSRAVAAYRQAAELALLTYRSVHDNTKVIFRQQLDDLVGGRQESTFTDFLAYKDSSNEAVQVAQEACDMRNPDISGISQRCITDLQAAREKYSSSRRQLSPNLHEATEQLSKEKNKARQEARRQFEQAMEKARSAAENNF